MVVFYNIGWVQVFYMLHLLLRRRWQCWLVLVVLEWKWAIPVEWRGLDEWVPCGTCYQLKQVCSLENQLQDQWVYSSKCLDLMYRGGLMDAKIYQTLQKNCHHRWYLKKEKEKLQWQSHQFQLLQKGQIPLLLCSSDDWFVALVSG